MGFAIRDNQDNRDELDTRHARLNTLIPLAHSVWLAA